MWFKSLPQANLSKQLFIIILFWLLTNFLLLGLNTVIFKLFPGFETQYNQFLIDINVLIQNLNQEKDIPEQLLLMGKEIKNNRSPQFFISFLILQTSFNLINYAFLALLLRKLLFKTVVLPFNKVKISIYVLTILLFFAAMPILNESIKLNEYLGLDKLALQTKETSYSVLVTTYSLVIDTNTTHQILIVLCMALIPAIGEELFFRGVLQKTIGNQIDIHLTILVTSFLFSLFHFEMVAFFYRFLFGVILGYLYYYTKNLTPSILLHFINNFSSIMAVNYIPNSQDLSNLEQFPTSILIFSCISLGFIFYTLHLYHQQQKLQNED